jgi:hypothetical protein
MLEFLDKNLKWISLITIAVIALLTAKQCKENSDLQEKIANLTLKNTILEGNVSVLKDTVKFWKDEFGNYRSDISILSADRDMRETLYRDINQRYLSLVKQMGDDAKMIAYLNGQITFKDRQITDLRSDIASSSNSRIINDSTIRVEVGKQYDSLNSYKVDGFVYAKVNENKIKAGKIDLTTAVNMGIELGLTRDEKTKIASITTRTAFPAKISMKGLTEIENQLNKIPKSYLGLGFFAGYGATLQKQPMLTPMIGVGVYYAPSWLTIKFYKK